MVRKKLSVWKKGMCAEKFVQSSKEKKELVSAIEAPNCKRFLKKLWQQLMRWGVASNTHFLAIYSQQ